MIPPNSRPDLPTFALSRGAIVRVHLGFHAKSITVSIGTRTIRPTLDATKRIASWKGLRGGILTVSVRSLGGASYVARLRVT
jgi:hypothetical protein